MRHRTAPRSPRALTAIAAVLALSTFPAAAQEAPAASPAPPPTLSLPQDVNTGSPADASRTTAAAPAPLVMLPAEAVALPPAEVVAAPPPAAASVTTSAAAASEPASTRQRTATRSSTRTVSAPAAEVAPSVPTAPTAGAAADGALAEGAIPPSAPAPARADVAPGAQDTVAAPAQSSSELPLAGIAGLLAALGIAGIGVAAMRRRRKEAVYDEAPYGDAPDGSAAEPPAQPVHEPYVPLAVSAPERVPERAMDEQASRPHAPAAAGAAAVLAAARLPQGAEERRDLLDRMADAPPDEANPFTSRKGRLRRARIQLQHREHLVAEREGQASPFDFRTYSPSTPAGGETTAPAVPGRVPGMADA